MQKVYQIENKPIVVSVQPEKMTLDTVNENRKLITKLFEAISGDKYLIIDLRNSSTSFGEVLKIMFSTGKGRDKTISSDKTKTFVLGANDLLRAFQNRLVGKHALNVVLLETMEEAMQAIEEEMADDTV